MAKVTIEIDGVTHTVEGEEITCERVIQFLVRPALIGFFGEQNVNEFISET